jgi:hypothetical protein
MKVVSDNLFHLSVSRNRDKPLLNKKLWEGEA